MQGTCPALHRSRTVVRRGSGTGHVTQQLDKKTAKNLIFRPVCGIMPPQLRTKQHQKQGEPQTSAHTTVASRFELHISNFRFVSDFDIRISDFLPIMRNEPNLPTRPPCPTQRMPNEPNLAPAAPRLCKTNPISPRPTTKICKTNPILVYKVSHHPTFSQNEPNLNSAHDPITRNEPNFIPTSPEKCQTNPIPAYPASRLYRACRECHPPFMRNEPNSHVPLASRRLFQPNYAKRTQSATRPHANAQNEPNSPPRCLSYFLISTFSSLAGNSPRHPTPNYQYTIYNIHYTIYGVSLALANRGQICIMRRKCCAV